MRDVQVGWSLLVGVVGGLTMTLLFQGDIMLAASVGGSPEFLPAALDPLNNALGVRPMVGHVLRQVVEVIYDGLLTMLVFGVIKATPGAGWRGLVLFVLVRAVFATLGATLAVVDNARSRLVRRRRPRHQPGRNARLCGLRVRLFASEGCAADRSMQWWYAERGMMALLLVVALGVTGFILTSSTEVARRLLPSRTWRTEL